MLRAEQNVLLDPEHPEYLIKFNYWNDYSNVINHQTFFFQGPSANYTARHIRIGNAKILTNLISADGDSSGYIMFCDPWLIDQPDPPFGMKNRGLIAEPLLYDSPLNLTVNSISHGVFPYQDPYFDPDIPNYSVSAPLEQFINYHEKNIEWYFINWEGLGVIFQNASALETPILFQNPNAIAKAIYKGHLASSTDEAIAYNNGHKMVKGNQNYYLTYEDDGAIYYTRSSDLVNWDEETRMCTGNTNHYPSTAVGYAPGLSDIVHFVWNKTENNTTKVIYADKSLIQFPIYQHTPAHESHPVIENFSYPFYYNYYYTENFLVVFEGYNGLYYVPLSYEESEGIESSIVPGTNSNSRFPSLQMIKTYEGGGDKEGIAYEEESQIYCIPFSSSGGYSFQERIPISEDISNFNHHPSLAIEHNSEEGYFWIAWDGQAAMPPSWSILVYSEKTGTYYTFSSWLKFYYYPSLRIDNSQPEIISRYLSFEESYNHDVYHTFFDEEKGCWNIPAILNDNGEKPNIAANYKDSDCDIVYTTEQGSPFILKTESLTGEEENLKEQMITYNISREIKFDISKHPLMSSLTNPGSGNLTIRVQSYETNSQSLLFSPLLDSLSVENFLSCQPFEVIADTLKISLNLEGKNIVLHEQMSKYLDRSFIKFGIKNLVSGQIVSNPFCFTIGDLISIGQSNFNINKEIVLNLKMFKGQVLIIEEEVLKRLDFFQPKFIENYNIIFPDSIKESSIIAGSAVNSDNFIRSFKLYQNYPNPFNPATTIAFDLLEDSFVELVIYDITGRRIRTLVKDQKPAGTRFVEWDGTDDRGVPVSSGVYVYSIQAGAFVQSKKMLFVK